jgi:(p)ppGpp synthase/HD superfamily hydrolase
MTDMEYNKLKLSFKYWLLGKAEYDSHYYEVLRALEIGLVYHNGKRKNGAPEFSHQIQMCLYLKTLHKFLIDPVAVFMVAILHDTYEDYPDSHMELKKNFPNYFDYFVRISKIRHGKKISYNQYFGEMKECDVCSIVKLADRISNISTMIDVFSSNKKTEYLGEVHEFFFPMLKHAKNKFPEQESAYANLKSVLIIQKDTILKMMEIDK